MTTSKNINAKELIMSLTPQDLIDDPFRREEMSDAKFSVLSEMLKNYQSKVSKVEPKYSRDLIIGYADHRFNYVDTSIGVIKIQEFLDSFEFIPEYEEASVDEINDMDLQQLLDNPPPVIPARVYLLVFTEWERVLGCDVSSFSIDRWGRLQMGLGILQEINGQHTEENVSMILAAGSNLGPSEREEIVCKLLKKAWFTKIDKYNTLRDEYFRLDALRKCS